MRQERKPEFISILGGGGEGEAGRGNVMAFRTPFCNGFGLECTVTVFLQFPLMMPGIVCMPPSRR